MKSVFEQAILFHGSHRRAAAAVGMKRSTFHDHAKRLGIIKPRVRGGD
jgi:hypothetical protein